MTEKNKIPLLVLVGPTAVGKTAAAIKLAEMLETEIISADSAQIYRGLDVGTAKPTVEEQGKVKHHLIDLLEPDQPYSAAEYQKAADKTIIEIWNSGKMPFMVGGTGLYIKAVTDRYAFGKKGPSPKLREELQDKASREGVGKLYSTLKKVDPKAASAIHPHDQKRIIRALEVYYAEGKPISSQVEKTSHRVTPYRTVKYGLNMERHLLYKRIEQRVEVMIEEGFVEEVSHLYAKGYNGKMPGMQILGYRQMEGYIKGLYSWQEMVASIKKETRNLAKRQLTWFRREKDICWLEITADFSHSQAAEIIYNKVKDLAPSQANIVRKAIDREEPDI
ncbi:MAG: tRNA (adenosine(37)-N6)-dimethylallyltransferase MiaA [Bacillota bacterium]|nr:tRNA (adenosine(37)-N6)-dimethylallyltransferase MiaA [Bacillota bacterium]